MIQTHNDYLQTFTKFCQIFELGGGSVAEAMWWVGRLRRLWGGWSQSENNATLWFHLARFNFQDSWLDWESKMELSMAICQFFFWSDTCCYFFCKPNKVFYSRTLTLYHNTLCNIYLVLLSMGRLVIKTRGDILNTLGDDLIPKIIYFCQNMTNRIFSLIQSRKFYFTLIVLVPITKMGFN